VATRRDCRLGKAGLQGWPFARGDCHIRRRRLVLCCSTASNCFCRAVSSLASGIRPQHFIVGCLIIADIVLLVVSCALSAMHDSKAHLVHEIECFNRNQNCALDSCYTVLARDAQEGQERVDVRRVDETTNTDHPQDNPTIIPLP
jgi:hypothetical protein